MTAPPIERTCGINVALLEELTGQLGASNDVARAKLLNLSRTTLWRYRTARMQPDWATARRIADQLDVPMAELFPGFAS